MVFLNTALFVDLESPILRAAHALKLTVSVAGLVAAEVCLRVFAVESGALAEFEEGQRSQKMRFAARRFVRCAWRSSRDGGPCVPQETTRKTS